MKHSDNDDAQYNTPLTINKVAGPHISANRLHIPLPVRLMTMNNPVFHDCAFMNWLRETTRENAAIAAGLNSALHSAIAAAHKISTGTDNGRPQNHNPASTSVTPRIKSISTIILFLLRRSTIGPKNGVISTETAMLMELITLIIIVDPVCL